MNFYEFFGRLHPLVVHLPIGFLLIAVLLEWFKGKDASKGKNRAIVFILFLGAISAIIAAVFGWLLANDGYDENTLFWHKWLGISAAVFAIIAWWTKRKKEKKIYKFSIWSIAILLLVTGHFGGSLTHGSDYLLQPLQGDADKTDLAANLPKQPDSVQVYNHLIQPVLEQKCYSCHNPEKKQGGLDMTTWDAFLEGGENGHVLENNVWESELFKRVTLPEDSKKFMPPKGIPLSYSEKILLKWWILQGANPEGMGQTSRDELLQYASGLGVKVPMDADNDFTFDKEFFFLYNKRMSPEVVAFLDKALADVFADGKVQETLKKSFFIPNFRTSAEAQKHFQAKRDSYAKIIENLHK